MGSKTTQKKKVNVAGWIAYILLATATVAITIFSANIFGVVAGVDDSGATIWKIVPFFSGTVSDNPIIQYLYGQGLPNLIRSVQILGFAVTLGVILHLLARITFRAKKAKTISILIANFLKWVIAIATVFLILATWGADTTMMIASAGVVTLIIGLGSQALVADIIAGIFIVFEGDFQVGDIVIIDEWRGEVISIGIRTTRLIDAGGNVKIVNNSSIKTLVNQTQELSVAKAYVSISYDARIEAVEAIISDNLDKMGKAIPAIIEGPFYKGVAELGESGVNLLFVAKCKEDDIYQVQRDLNRQIKIVFDDNNVEIPFNQVVVHNAKEEAEAKLSKLEKMKSEQFLEDQRNKSKDIVVEDK